MTQEQHPIAVDNSYKIRDDQFWYNNCSFRHLVENKKLIVVNIDGLGILTLEHSKQGNDGRPTLSYKLPNDIQKWWETQREKLVKVELLDVKEELRPTENEFLLKNTEKSYPVLIARETEFYQGYIRFKMSVSNKSSFVISDVALDFHFDEKLLHITEYGNTSVKNGKILLGNLYGGKAKSISVLFEPLTCTKAADIKCQVTYANHEGNMFSLFMEPKEISVVCPIMQTDQDINTGRLKEFIELLPNHDSRIYEIQNAFDVKNLVILVREVLQKHDVRHVRTLHTRDKKNCEIWYYGRTKVNRDDIVIRISIFATNKTMELFAATHSAKTLTGLLAEIGRELKQAVESKVNGRIANVHIKDSVVQRSNLLDMCNIDDNCNVNLVIEDSVVQRTSICTNDSDIERKKYEEIETKQQEEVRLNVEHKRKDEEMHIRKKKEDAERKTYASSIKTTIGKQKKSLQFACYLIFGGLLFTILSLGMEGDFGLVIFSLGLFLLLPIGFIYLFIAIIRKS